VGTDDSDIGSNVTRDDAHHDPLQGPSGSVLAPRRNLDRHDGEATIRYETTMAKKTAMSVLNMRELTSSFFFTGASL
jgi:hypothetical protein